MAFNMICMPELITRIYGEFKSLFNARPLLRSTLLCHLGTHHDSRMQVLGRIELASTMFEPPAVATNAARAAAGRADAEQKKAEREAAKASGVVKPKGKGAKPVQKKKEEGTQTITARIF